MSGDVACLAGSRRGWRSRDRTGTFRHIQGWWLHRDAFGMSTEQPSHGSQTSDVETLERGAGWGGWRDGRPCSGSGGCCCGEPWAKEIDYCHATTTASRRGSTPARGRRNSRWIPCHEVQVRGPASAQYRKSKTAPASMEGSANVALKVAWSDTHCRHRARPFGADIVHHNCAMPRQVAPTLEIQEEPWH